VEPYRTNHYVATGFSLGAAFAALDAAERLRSLGRWRSSKVRRDVPADGGSAAPPDSPAFKVAPMGGCRHSSSSNAPVLGWAGLGWAGLGWAGLGWAGLGWAGLGWAWLGWAGLGWAGLGWAVPVLCRRSLLALVLLPWPLVWPTLAPGACCHDRQLQRCLPPLSSHPAASDASPSSPCALRDPNRPRTPPRDHRAGALACWRP
jgi:hypothetical protein